MAVTKVTPAGLSLTQIGRNLFYNGDFSVWQRGDVSGLGTAAAYTADGVKYASVTGSEAGRLTIEKSTTVPAGSGHKQSLKVDVTTADSSIAAGEGYYLELPLEAQNCSHLDYGAATAKSLCISFWTRSSTTGDYQFMLEAPDGSRAYSTSYNIASADTWEKKKIVIAGDSSGTINNDTGIGLILRFSLTLGSNFQGGTEDAWATTANNMYAAGSTLNLLSSTSNDWYIAGLLVEEGDEVTNFPFEDYGTTLRKCHRYYERQNFADASYQNIVTGHVNASNQAKFVWTFSTKRATPTLGSTAAGTFYVYENDDTGQTASAIALEHASPFSGVVKPTLSSAATGAGRLARDATDTTYLEASAEL
jgi:hypothetical protein